MQENNIPLVGGISICLSIAQFLTSNPDAIPYCYLFLGYIATLIVVGVLDDKFDISFKFRLFVQTILSIGIDVFFRYPSREYW